MKPYVAFSFVLAMMLGAVAAYALRTWGDQPLGVWVFFPYSAAAAVCTWAGIAMYKRNQ